MLWSLRQKDNTVVKWKAYTTHTHIATSALATVVSMNEIGPERCQLTIINTQSVHCFRFSHPPSFSVLSFIHSHLGLDWDAKLPASTNRHINEEQTVHTNSPLIYFSSESTFISSVRRTAKSTVIVQALPRHSLPATRSTNWCDCLTGWLDGTTLCQYMLG